MFATCLAIALCLIAIGPARKRPAVAQAVDPPNILLIVTDDQRAGTTQDMVNLARGVARRGIAFGRAFVPTSLCCPARVSILTGRYAHTTGVWNNAGPFGVGAFDDSSTIATSLHDTGYRTGLFGKYLNGWWVDDQAYVPPGWDEWFAFMSSCCSYYGFDASVNGTPTSFGSDVYGTTESAERAAAFISSTNEPVFVVWAPPAPHWPATPEQRYAGAYADLAPWRPPSYMEADVSDKPAWVRSLPVWDGAKRRETDALRRQEYETLLSVDDGVGVLLDALAANGELSSTLIAYTSDNGMMWGEHRLDTKPFPWRSNHRIPFFVRYDPIVTAGARSPALVSTIDLAPTIAALAGVDGSATDGRSLLPLLTGERAAIRTFLILEHAAPGRAPASCGIRTSNELFVRYVTGEEEYYDYRKDRWELRNAAYLDGVRRRVRTLRQRTRDGCSPTPPGFSW